MGLIVDTSELIAGERCGEAVEDIAGYIRSAFGDIEVALSTVTVVELTHGIYRAKSKTDMERRRAFAQQPFQIFTIHSVDFDISQLAGRIDGEQAAKGLPVPFEDLVIGATALYLGYGALTRNAKHFKLIPGLAVHTL